MKYCDTHKCGDVVIKLVVVMITVVFVLVSAWMGF